MSGKASGKKVQAIAPKQNQPKSNLNNSSAQHVVTSVQAPTVSAGDFSSKWLNTRNSYLASLRDPFGVDGARIPDGESELTSTLQVTYRVALSSNGNAGNVAGLLMGYPGTTNVNGPCIIPQNACVDTHGGGSLAGAQWLTTTTDAAGGGSTSQVFFDGTLAASGSLGGNVTGLASFLAAYTAKARLVSCALVMRPAVSATQNAGFIIGGSLAGNFFGSAAMSSTNMSVNALTNYPGATRVACSSIVEGGGITVTYTPFDNANTEYSPTSIAANAAGFASPYFNQFNPGILYVVATGGGAANLTYLVDICFNFEAIPASGAFAFVGRPTIDDPIAIATAMNARKTDPLVTPGSLEAQESAGAKSSTSKTVDLAVSHRDLESKRMKSSPDSSKRRYSSKDEEDARDQIPSQEIGFVRCHLATNVGVLPMLGGSGSKNKRRGDVVQEVEEKPLFESLLDTVGGIAVKAIPKLASKLLAL